MRRRLASASGALFLVGALSLVDLPPPLSEVLGTSAVEAAPRRAHRTAGRRSVRRSHARHHHRDDVRRRRRAVAGTALVVGSVARALPSGCRTVVRRGVSYHRCGSTWYEPRYEGTTVVYVVIEEP